MTKIITSKLLAADAAPGVAMLLAYYAGGTNLFPKQWAMFGFTWYTQISKTTP